MPARQRPQVVHLAQPLASNCRSSFKWANISSADQLEQLARAAKNDPVTEENQSQQPSQQEADAFLFTDQPYTAQSSGPTPSYDQPDPNTSFTNLISAGLFEQQPAQEMILFLYGLSQYCHPSRLTDI